MGMATWEDLSFCRGYAAERSYYDGPLSKGCMMAMHAEYCQPIICMSPDSLFCISC
ncbi:hypothetical protein COCSUDRAFT_33219 [Coccomyxa subellipsoidea C-169]|uniref:Uncharacterized protein n=1 Tax=Coccomyxa subellipsoidea (strain C-169) TaxID=574566 RepID=I0YX96_COCSC|nr:hypothetical protein COCSUDRAFT_33219 [Coccomyxa subellipsoidea C-169]EIE23015.1 hypothetical protein COCSUDRAFT_33219 [Coccomyxa subellipsoidea C-169]|eukprot:XP_005647559.1 hypothetical protein COCSUDRAFT_33219 [Coccomyxa subellipsoidea C-169]